MNVSPELLNKLVSSQLTNLMSAYMAWITPEAHALAIPTRNVITHSVEQGTANWDKRYVITIKYFTRDVKFTFYSNGHEECSRTVIDFHDITSAREKLSLVSEVTYEIYLQLNKYAIENVIPPENLVI